MATRTSPSGTSTPHAARSSISATARGGCGDPPRSALWSGKRGCRPKTSCTRCSCGAARVSGARFRRCQVCSSSRWIRRSPRRRRQRPKASLVFCSSACPMRRMRSDRAPTTRKRRFKRLSARSSARFPDCSSSPTCASASTPHTDTAASSSTTRSPMTRRSNSWRERRCRTRRRVRTSWRRRT